MSNGLNNCQFIGNLAADAELRIAPGGNAVLKFRIGCSESWKDRNGQKQEKTEWVSCVMWGPGATAVAAYLVKGKQVYVAGKLQTNVSEKDGQKRYFTSINVKNLLLLGGRAKSEGQPEQCQPAAQSGGGGYSDADYESPADDEAFPF